MIYRSSSGKSRLSPDKNKNKNVEKEEKHTVEREKAKAVLEAILFTLGDSVEIGRGTPRRIEPAKLLYQIKFQKPVYRKVAAHAPYPFDIQLCHRLLVSDDRKGFQQTGQVKSYAYPPAKVKGGTG